MRTIFVQFRYYDEIRTKYPRRSFGKTEHWSVIYHGVPRQRRFTERSLSDLWLPAFGKPARCRDIFGRFITMQKIENEIIRTYLADLDQTFEQFNCPIKDGRK